MTILSKIVKEVKKRVEREKESKYFSEKVRDSYRSLSFIKSIKDCSDTPVIGELKKSSPSAGEIRSNFDVVKLSKSIEEGGAVAVSVLTEPQFFDGSLEYLEKVKNSVDIPVLRKDFIVDRYQLYQTADVGADAVLLITEILEDELSDFVDLSNSLGIEPLVEVSNKRQAEHVDSLGCSLVGINNRNLSTMNVDLSRTKELIDIFSNGPVVVSESGLRKVADVERVIRMGADAVLVGSAIMKSNNVEKKVNEFVSGVGID